MSDQSKIKFVAISGVSGSKIVTTCGAGTPLDESYKAESKVILDKLQDVYLKAGERQKIKTAHGSWFSTCDSKDIFYLILTDKNFPERNAYSLVSDLITILKSDDNYETATEETIHDQIKQILPELLERHNSVDASDNLTHVQAKANQIKEVIADTVHKVIENKDAMENLDRKSENLNTIAKGFQDSSSSLSNKYKNQNQRKIIIYTCITLFVIFFLYLVLK